MIKLVDTMKPMSDFFVAEAEDIGVEIDGEEKSLQDVINNGEIGGGSGSWVGTQAKFDAYDKSQLKDAQEVIITDDYDVVNGNVYSTEEKVVGYWIDNKPIYRKLLDRGSYKGSGDVSAVDCNIDRIIKIDVVNADNSDGSGNQTVYSAIGGLDSRYAYYRVSDKHIVVSGKYYSRYIILEYTKTTD